MLFFQILFQLPIICEEGDVTPPPSPEPALEVGGQDEPQPAPPSPEPAPEVGGQDEPQPAAAQDHAAHLPLPHGPAPAMVVGPQDEVLDEEFVSTLFYSLINDNFL